MEAQTICHRQLREEGTYSDKVPNYEFEGTVRSDMTETIVNVSISYVVIAIQNASGLPRRRY